MLSDAYGSWCADQKTTEFAQGFTENDFFRVCPWEGPADGKKDVLILSGKLPALKFKPAPLTGHRLILENSGHIYDTRCRLVHCLRVNKGEEQAFAPGEYDFFEGIITIQEERKP